MKSKTNFKWTRDKNKGVSQIANPLKLFGVPNRAPFIGYDFSDALNTVKVMLNSGYSLRSSLKMLLLDAIAPVLGVIIHPGYQDPRELSHIVPAVLCRRIPVSGIFGSASASS